MIKMQDVYMGYRDHHVLSGLNLEVRAGEIYGFIGHNGAGKSTTMMLLMGILKAKAGLIEIDGTGPGIQRIGYLPEEPRFFLFMSAVEYLRYIGRLAKMPSRAIALRSHEVLEQVGLLKDASRAIGGYSRGMKQRLGLAVALFHDPKILLLDEPSSALDPLGRKDVVTILEGLKRKGKTIFLSTHILNDIERVCDRIGILHQGCLRAEGDLDTLLRAGQGHTYSIRLVADVPQDVPGDLAAALGTLAGVTRVTLDSGEDGEGEYGGTGGPSMSLAFDKGCDEEGLKSFYGQLGQYGAYIEAVSQRVKDLEDLYTEVITSGK